MQATKAAEHCCHQSRNFCHLHFCDVHRRWFSLKYGHRDASHKHCWKCSCQQHNSTTPLTCTTVMSRAAGVLYKTATTMQATTAADIALTNT
jgi:hypothetical protein